MYSIYLASHFACEHQASRFPLTWVVKNAVIRKVFFQLLTQEVVLTNSSLLTCTRRYVLLVLLAVLLSACASTYGPPIINEHADYGPIPEDYQAITKGYLQSKPRRSPLDVSTTQFLNTPDKFTYTKLGREDTYGYRVCARVSTANGRETLSQFLLINNGKVVEHFHDSGLIRLSDKYCNMPMLLFGIKSEAMAAEVAPVAAPVEAPVVAPGVAPVVTPKVAPVVVAPVPVTAVDKQDFKFIVCRANGEEKFFAFSAEKNQLLEQRDGRVVTTFVVEQFSDTFITATAAENTRVSINRVSGTMRYQHTGIESEGSCELASQQRF
jgi:hypothetical protein